ncbi:hypothetical protein ZEAMMB73_Zm00001d043186 [Zea mays]|uniref:Uncharacterized protein n=1 Tax=Zea mays TaxID=4577 RepID=A0A1D6N9F8_MAIZE|nr:hypothetical protein ZEAMMB73_Zm00001d043186 [Zea mays]
MGSMAITVSNNYFTHHNKWLDFSSNGEGQDNACDSYVEDKAMQVTIAFNHFCEGLIQRMPRHLEDSVLLRSALQATTSEVLKVVEDGLREASFEIGLDDRKVHKEMDEIYTMATIISRIPWNLRSGSLS